MLNLHIAISFGLLVVGVSGGVVKRSVEEPSSSSPAPLKAPTNAPAKATAAAKAPLKSPTKGRKAGKASKPIIVTNGQTVGKTEKPDIENSREAIQNRLEKEKDTMELKMAIVSELDDYHEVQQKIKFLEDHLEKHANFHVVNDKEILDASQTLKEMKEKIINPLEHNLVAVRNQILKMDHELDDKEKIFIKSVLENADQFLATSKSRLESLELVEQEWESLEESEKIKISTKTESKASSDSLANRDASSGGGLRSQRLQKIRDIVASKINEHERKTEHVQIKNIDIAMLKKELDREKMLDTEPGYGKRIKAALNEAAEKSHKFIHDNLAHGHSDTDITHEDGSIKFSWILVFVFGTLSLVLSVCVVCLLLNRPATISLRRKLFKDDTTFGYCELNDVRGEKQSGVANSSSSWNEDSWGNWDDNKSKNSQKLK